ncbi:MAG: type I-B CRISPR-associated protein Cas8b1/Cst1 [Clostridium sp.]|uniref:type I-B CRISPR-associated protein Cas8b1/Cst1 n=1 Tax=Clostridium sp. TaxID=1506 RepID=UPI003F2B52A2
MGKIRIQIGDWLKNTGIIGLIKILEHSQNNLNSIVVKNDYIEFEEELLENFEEKYFEYMIYKYKNQISIVRIIGYKRRVKALLDKTNLTKDDAKEVERMIKLTKEKLISKSYLSAYFLIRKELSITDDAKNIKEIRITKKEIKDEISVTKIENINLSLQKINEVIKKLEETKKFKLELRDEIKNSISSKVKFDEELVCKEDITKENVEIIIEFIKDVKKKLSSKEYLNRYLISDEYVKLEEEVKNFKKVKISSKGKEPLELATILEIKNNLKELAKIINILEEEQLFKVIAAKNVIYDVIQHFWGGISFLHSQKSEENMFSLYREEFIQPIIKYTSVNKEEYEFSCFTCSNKILKLNKDKQNVFNMTWINNIGVDMEKKSSHFWNLCSDAYICPVCNLVYSCIPAGFNFINGRGIFINNNISIKTLNQTNIIQGSIDKENFENIENEAYLNIINLVEQEKIEKIEYELDNIQVIKFDGYGNRKYTFNMLSKRVLYVLYKNRGILNSLIKVRIKITEKYTLNLYQEVLRRLVNNCVLYDLLEQLMTLYLCGIIKKISIIDKILAINNSIRGGEVVKKCEREKFRDYGNELKRSYLLKNSESKLVGISYRMLNALKTDNSSKFMESLVNAYMYVKKAIPTDLIAILGYSDEFQNAGYSFLIGLQGEVKEVEGNGNGK